MKVILEGPDGAGKSFFARHNLPGFACRSTTLVPKDYRDSVRGMVGDVSFLGKSGRGDLALDRSFIISEYVYSSVLGRRKYVTKDFLLSFLGECRKKGVKIMIFLYRDFERTRGSTLKKKDRSLPIKRLNEFYRDTFLGLGHPNISIRYAEDFIKRGGKKWK